MAACAPTPGQNQQPGTITGRVIDLNGAPVANAQVTASGGSAQSNGNGDFAVTATPSGSWVSVAREGFVSRTRAGEPGDPLLVRLTPDDGQTVALQFGGDVMMGRRFFDPNEDGRRSDELIDDPSDVAAHRALLAPIAPLLADADLTAVNVESPLSAEPYINPTDPRPARVHPTKEFVFASGTGLPAALEQSGVDVVGLANNHQYDLLESGVRDTVEGFTTAGFAPGVRQFGLGDTVEAGYLPAVAEARGARFAYLGCTTITGAENPVSYVAGPGKGGAAPCDPLRVRDAVAAAKASGAVVIFSVHGGFEYGRTPSGQVREFTRIAREAGATLVVNHHPHVTGGLDWDGTSLAAWSLGNLVFDQDVWPTFQSYTLNVHVRAGRIVRAYLEPLMVDDYVAHGVRNELADYVSRSAAGLSQGPCVVEDGAVELDLGGRPPAETATATLPPAPAGSIGEIEPGWTLARADPATVEFGKDLLWAGDFEDSVQAGAPGALWTESSDSRAVPDPDPARGWVYQLHRDDTDADPVVASVDHRPLLTNPGSVRLRRSADQLADDDAAPPPGAPGRPPAAAPAVAAARVSMTGLVRVPPGARLEVQMSWFPDTRGPSSSQTVRVIDGNVVGGRWQPLRIDAAAPPDAVAVQPFLRLTPPRSRAGQPEPPSEIDAAVDAVRLIEWSPPGSKPSPQATHLRSVPGANAEFVRAGSGLERAAGGPLTVLAN